MGIHKLFHFIQQKAPEAVREIRMEVYTSKTVACDASKVRSADDLPVRGFDDELRAAGGPGVRHESDGQGRQPDRVG